MTREQRINTILSQQLQTVFLAIDNESYKHHVPNGSETHFKLIVVAQDFQSLPKIARHRLIHKLLVDELNSGLHALSLHLYTPTEWDSQQTQVPQTPSCRDGYDRDEKK